MAAAPQKTILEIISETAEGDDVVSKLTEGKLTKESISLDQYQILIEMLMAEVDAQGKKENNGETVVKGSYTIIDPGQKVYKFLHGYHQKAQAAEKQQSDESGWQYFIRRFITGVPRSYSRDPTSRKSSHYKKCPDQYGIDFRHEDGRLKSILPDNPDRPKLTHLLFGDLSPAFGIGKTPTTFLKMETVGIGTVSERLTHGLNYLKSRKITKSIMKGVDFLINLYNKIKHSITGFLSGRGSGKGYIALSSEKEESAKHSARRESYIDKKIVKEYEALLKEFEVKIGDSYKKRLDRAIKKKPKSIKVMLDNLKVFEKLSLNKEEKEYFKKRIREFESRCAEIKGYSEQTLSYRHGDEVILDLRKNPEKQQENQNIENRAQQIRKVFDQNQNLGFIKPEFSGRPINSRYTSIAERLGLVYNTILMKDEDGNDMMVEMREKLGFGGFGTAYKAVVISGKHQGEVFVIKQQRLASLARDNFFSRFKQFFKRPFMEAPNEAMETKILKLQGMFFGEAYINYKQGTVATGDEALPDPRVHQLGRERTKSRYYVLQPFMDGGDFSNLYSNVGNDKKRSWANIPLEDSSALLNSAISSLFNLHKNGFAHNDLHHENIMTMKRKEGVGDEPGSPPMAYVMDFGRATEEFLVQEGVEPAFTKAQVADINMMVKGKPGKAGSLLSVFGRMCVNINDSYLSKKEKDEAISIISAIKDKLLLTKEGEPIVAIQADIRDLFIKLDRILVKEASAAMQHGRGGL